MNPRPEDRSAIRNRSRDEKYPEIVDRYRLIAENSIDVIWQMDLRLRFTYVSPAIFPMTGYTPEEWVGTKLSQHARGDEFWKMARKALKAIKNYKKFDHIVFEAKMLRKDGDSIPVEINSKLIRDEKGVPIGIQGSTRDITERKRIEESLVRQNELLSAHQETTLELLSQLKLQDLLENIVRRATALLGTESGYLELVDSETGQLKPQVGLGALAESLQFEVEAGEGVAGTVWQTGKPLIVNEYDSWESRVDKFSRGTLSAVIGVPLVSNGRVLGVLGLAHECGARRVFGREDVEVLTQFAHLAAIAIENARLFSTLQRELSKRRETESILRESERSLSILMGNLPGMAYRCKNDVKWTMEYVSEGCQLLTGYKPEDLVENNLISFREVIHPDDRQRVWDEIQAAIRKNKKFQIMYRIHTATGVEKWVWEQGQKSFFSDAEDGILEGFIADITGQKQIEQELFNSRQMLQTIINSIPQRVFWKDRDLRYLGCNGHFAKDAGLDDTQEILGKTDCELSWHASADMYRTDDMEVIRNNVPKLDFEETMQLDDRSTIWLRTNKVPLRDSTGGVYGVLGTYENITEKKSAEIQYQTILRTAFDGFWVVDTRGLLLDVNEAYCNLSGFARDELLKMRVFDLEASTTEGITKQRFERMQAGGRDRFTTKHRRRDGSIVAVEISVTFLNIAGGRYFVFIQDITERIEAELATTRYAQELERSNTDLQQFAYVISHDLQEPLRMVSSYLKLLERRYKGSLDKDADEFIQFAVDGATRMQQLINDLLTYSRVGTHGKEQVPVRAEEVLTAALHNLSISIRESGATVTHDKLPVVLADRSQFIQLFQNLIGNAVKFRSDEPVEVHVGVEQAKGPGGEPMWQFSVSDNGIGIDPQYFGRIFVIFQRLHTKDAYSGTGMGLSISKRIVDRHGGRIWLESEPGNGTTFYFTLRASNGKLEV